MKREPTEPQGSIKPNGVGIPCLQAWEDVNQYHKLPKNASKKNFIADMDEIVQHEDYMEGGRYPASQLTWHDDKVYNTYDDAKQAIDKMDKGFYDDHAVLYYDTDSVAVKPSKALESAKMKLDKLIAARDKYVNESRVYHRSSEFIGCTECGSKISRKWLKSDYCPVCKHDLRPNSTLNRIASFDRKQRRKPRLFRAGVSRLD